MHLFSNNIGYAEFRNSWNDERWQSEAFQEVGTRALMLNPMLAQTRRR